jgi:hypothetical protein
VGLIVSYDHPSRTMIFAAIGTFAIAGCLLAGGFNASRGRIGLLISAGLFGAIGFYWVFAAIWFKVRGSPFQGGNK